MREILFRGKRVDNGEWEYGAYIKATRHWHKRGIHEDWICSSVLQNGGYLNMVSKYPVTADSIGQYTGLTDKKGEKIFEGDVLNFVWFSSFGVARDDRGVVRYDDEFCAFCVTSNAGGTWAWSEVEHAEVIGNIHDDAYLMED